jgi:enhancing lycopene biosynthesis protein 2
MTHFAVVLSGCGYLDGAEIHESVCTLLAIDRIGAEWTAFAPDAPQSDVVDHVNRTPGGHPRNILAESARIARGHIHPTTALEVSKFDALVFPGGFGAAKNLCNFATAGADCQARPEIVTVIREAHRLGKPIGAICIAPAVIAAAFRGTPVHPTLTIGNDASTAKALASMGANHQNCDVRHCVVDEAARIVTTPAYMLAKRIGEAAEGIERLVKEVARLAGQPATAAR